MISEKAHTRAGRIHEDRRHVPYGEGSGPATAAAGASMRGPNRWAPTGSVEGHGTLRQSSKFQEARAATVQALVIGESDA
jgi:hypothetical protein